MLITNYVRYFNLKKTLLKNGEGTSVGYGDIGPNRTSLTNVFNIHVAYTASAIV